MKILSTNVYVGPNIWAHFRVIRHIIDLGELEAWPTSRLGDAFIGPLLEVLPDYQDRGIGRELMRRILDRLDGLYMIDLTCLPELERFYGPLGLTRGVAMSRRDFDAQSGRARSEGP